MEINQKNAKEKELNEHLVHESFRRYMVQKKTQVQLLFHKLSFNLRFSWGFQKLVDFVYVYFQDSVAMAILEP